MNKKWDSFYAIIKIHIDFSATHFGHFQNSKNKSVSSKIYKLRSKRIEITLYSY